MIITENIMIGDRSYAHTYSDKGMLIERGGVRYADAIDPAEFGRTYTETDEPIQVDEITAAEALEIITGGTL